MASSSTVTRMNPNKPHVMCIPYPINDHIKPMLTSGALKSIANLHKFRFETIPAILPPPPPATTPDYYHLLCQSAREKFLLPLHRLVMRLNWCKTVSCIVSDGLMPFNIMIARELGIPGYLLWVPNACAFMGYLREKGLMPPKDEQLHIVLDSTSVLKNIHLSDIPHAKLYENGFPDGEAEEAFQAAGIIFETFKALEHDVFDAIKHLFQHVYAIGPLQMLLNLASIGTGNHLESVSFNQDEIHCLKWLDSMEPNSVVYVSFGDLTVLTPRQLCEFAWGIYNSIQPFLWMITPDFAKSQLATLPLEFLEKTKERGLIATWCPQEQVLAHPSVGVFVSHFGTSSMLESICAGVPMIGWPYFGHDHQVTCWYICNQWGIGMKMTKDMEREEVESLVRELMEGDEGKAMKRKAMEWKKLAVEATSKGR